MTTTVALVDDHPLVLTGMRALLDGAPAIQVIGTATEGREALQLIEAARPSVAVLDLFLPDVSGLEVASRLADSAPSVRVLALTVHEDRAYVERTLLAGARGYLLKRSAAEDLIRAIRAIAEGGVYLDPAVADKVLPAEAGSTTISDCAEQLSPREAEVIRRVAHGFSNKEIAGQLDVSVKTVETYKARAAEKLNIRTRAEIVRYGAARGWLTGLA